MTRIFLVMAGLLMWPAFALSSPIFHMLTEGDPASPGAANLYTFNSLTDLQNVNAAGAPAFLGNNVGGTAQSIGALAYDGSQFHLLREGDPGSAGSLRLFSFNSLADLITLTPAGSPTLLGNNVGGTAQSIAGLAYDGSQFHLLREGDPGSTGSLRLFSFNSLADLKTLTPAGSPTLLGNNVGGTAQSIAGLTYDGNQFHLLREGDPGSTGSLRLFSFNSLADLKTLTPAVSSTLLGNDVFGAGTSVRGLVSINGVDTVGVPEPTTLMLLLAWALMPGIGIFGRSRSGGGRVGLRVYGHRQ